MTRLWALFLILAAFNAHAADERIVSFQNFWNDKLAPNYTALRIDVVATLDRNDPKVPAATRDLYMRLLLAGGVVSWANGNAWNVVILEDTLKKPRRGLGSKTYRAFLKS
jgi:hypothetical protein